MHRVGAFRSTGNRSIPVGCSLWRRDDVGGGRRLATAACVPDLGDDLSPCRGPAVVKGSGAQGFFVSVALQRT